MNSREIKMEAKELFNYIQTYNPFNVDKAINLYLYGSRVYGTNDDNSDYDYLMVSGIVQEPYAQFKHDNINVTVFSLEEWVKRLQQHEISALECLYLPDEMVLKNSADYNVTIDSQMLRRAVSAKASNSFVKAKKKFTVENDIYTGKKSLFHALRIPMFGEQLAKHGKIVDYTVANHYWNQIRGCGIDDWNYFKKKYQPIFNNIMSSFRKVAPKG